VSDNSQFGKLLACYHEQINDPPEGRKFDAVIMAAEKITAMQFRRTRDNIHLVAESPFKMS